MARGNCYVTSEALFHLLGGKRAGWTPMRLRVGRETHWFLRHTSGLVIDVTSRQFPRAPRYAKARGCGFLTRRPSRRARTLMRQLVWQEAA
jgi:hypothetical protein